MKKSSPPLSPDPRDAASRLRDIMVYTLGPAGTFSHEATEKIFPGREITFAPNFDRTFELLMQEPDAIGVVPIENSLHGSVDEILDLLRETDVRVWRMHDVEIRHAFGAKDLNTVTKVASHNQALRQSRRWLKEHYPLAEHLPTTSTAAAVEFAKRDPTIGVIASSRLIRESGLILVAEDIEGNANTTRFGIISVRDPFPESKRTRMSIAIHPKPQEDRPGLLHALLTQFKEHNVNLTRIENRPTGKRIGDYNFFVDFIGGSGDPETEKVLGALSFLAEIRILGEW